MGERFTGPHHGKEIRIEVFNSAGKPWPVEFYHEGDRGISRGGSIIARINGGPATLKGENIRSKIDAVFREAERDGSPAVLKLQYDAWKGVFTVMK